MRRAASKHIFTSTTDERGATMGGQILYSDAKWLRKLCKRINLQASRNFPHSQFRIRITTTEVKRAERIEKTLAWLLQHVDVAERVGRDHVDITPDVPRGNPPT